MKIVLATGNKGKVKEIKDIFSDFDVIAYSDIVDAIDIIEDGDTFKSNAIIKSEAVYNLLKDKDVIVLADDSGISVDVLGGEPNIYSARYAGVGASDRDNLEKVCTNLKAKGVTSSPAHYTACIAITTDKGTFTTHGWMYGDVIDSPRGDGGFGYDPIFIPEGFDKTLGELSKEIKHKLSHRYKALQLMQKVIKNIQ